MNKEIKIYDVTKMDNITEYDIECCSIDCIDSNEINNILSSIVNFLKNNITKYSPNKYAINISYIISQIKKDININYKENKNIIELCNNDKDKFMCVIYQLIVKYLSTDEYPLVIDNDKNIFLVIDKCQLEEKSIYKIELNLSENILCRRYFSLKNNDIINLTDIPNIALELGIITKDEVNLISTVDKEYSLCNHISTGEHYTLSIKNNSDIKIYNILKDIFYDKYLFRTHICNIDTLNINNKTLHFVLSPLQGCESTNILNILDSLSVTEWLNDFITNAVFGIVRPEWSDLELLNSSCNNFDESMNNNDAVLDRCECDMMTCNCVNSPNSLCCNRCDITEDCGCYKRGNDKSSSDKIEKTIRIPVVPEDPKTEIFMLMKLISTRVKMLSDDTTDINITYNCINGIHNVSIDTNTSISIDTEIK